MDVIRNSVNSVQMAMMLVNNSRNVPVELFAVMFGYCWFPMLCTKNNLVDNLAITAHGIKFNGSQRLTPFGVIYNISFNCHR